MSGNPLSPRFGVFLLPGSQEQHCTQAISERNGSTVGIFQFPNYQALFDAASAEQLDAVICDSRALSTEARYFTHLLGEVLWYRYGLCLHELDVPDANSVNPIYQQLLTRILLPTSDDSETGAIESQPFGYAWVDGCQHITPGQSQSVVVDLIRRFAGDEKRE